jgi:hypothetical protein
VVAVSDLSVERLTQVNARYPNVKLTTDFRDVLCDPDVDAVIVATPVSSHFDIAMRALQAGKHVLVTKPMTADSEQAMQLIEAAEHIVGFRPPGRLRTRDRQPALPQGLEWQRLEQPMGSVGRFPDFHPRRGLVGRQPDRCLRARRRQCAVPHVVGRHALERLGITWRRPGLRARSLVFGSRPS